MGERTLTIDTKKLIQDATKEIEKANEKLALLEALSNDKKKIKKIKKCKSITEAARLIMISLSKELEN